MINVLSSKLIEGGEHEIHTNQHPSTFIGSLDF